MLDSFKALNARVLAPAGRGMTEWMFLEVWTCLLDAVGWSICQTSWMGFRVSETLLMHFNALQVHAEGEKEHAAIGHNAVLHFVPAEHEGILRKAMRQHDQDFAVFYNRMADMLEQL